MKLGALTGGAPSIAFNNFAKFTVKHLWWSLFLIKLQAWWCATLSRKKIQVHRSFRVSLLYMKTYFVKHVRTDAWVIWTKQIAFTKFINRETLVIASFFVQLQTCGLTIFQNELYHRRFSMKIGKLHRTSVLPNNAARVLLISCDIFDVSLTLSVINWFSHSMEI